MLTDPSQSPGSTERQLVAFTEEELSATNFEPFMTVYNVTTLADLVREATRRMRRLGLLLRMRAESREPQRKSARVGSDSPRYIIGGGFCCI